MNKNIRKLLAAMLFLAVSLQLHAQGLVIDQESYPGPINVQTPDVDGLFLSDEPLEQFTQSFIPSLSAIDYVALEFESSDVPATVEVKLYDSAEPSVATLIGTTTPVTMPSGFNNNGLYIAGVEDFYFSNPFVLVPGDTYYLEVLAVSGAANWAFVTVDNDNYHNGELYVNGYPYGNSTDMWFQEGIVAVPEPTTLALIGFGSLLVFIFKRRSKLPVLMFASALFTLPVLTTHASDSVTKATADAAGLTTVSPSDLPSTGGTYWITMLNGNGGLAALPWPFLPTNLDDPTIYSITNQIFLVDTTAGRLTTYDSPITTADATTAAQAQAQSMATLIENIENPPTPPGAGGDGTNSGYGTPHPEGIQINPDGLYIMATNEVPDGLGGLGFLLFNPDNSLNYQLLSTTNLLNTNWCLGPVIFYPGSSGNYFNPVPMTNTMTFFRVHQADPVIAIQNYQNATEINATNDLGQQGYFYLYNEGGQTNDVPVYYRISGTAQNGITYSNLTGVVIVSNNVNSAYIYVNPLTNGLQPNLSLILTLNQNPNYLIDPNYAAATNIITANPQVYPTVNGDNLAPCPNTQWPVYLNAQDYLGLTLSYVIVTWPKHGILDTNTAPSCYYTATNCFEGQDSFTFYVTDGVYSSGLATVNLNVSDPMYSSSLSVQTCRGTAVIFTLPVNNNCSETLSNYTLLSTPANGTLSNWPSTLTFTFTPDDTSFTGTNIFSYIAYSDCGDDSTTNSVTITIGDKDISTVTQNLITGTNQRVNVTLSTQDNGDSCAADTNYFTYTYSQPTNGVLTGTPPDLVYKPNQDFEGQDGFSYTFNDGTWTSSSPATITINVTKGPILFQDCNPFSTAILLSWVLDTNEQQMNLNIQDYILYRSTNSDFSNYTAIATNDVSTDSYLDTNAIANVTYYYELTFQSQDSPSGIIIESPRSDEVEASGQTIIPLIPYNAVWQVVTNLSTPNNITNLEAPMSDYYLEYPGQPYPGMAELPNSYWATGTTMSNSIIMYIPTNSVPLSQVTYSIAIDNDYQLYLNNTNAPIQTFNHEDDAIWVPYQSFEDVAPGRLHYGTNNLSVVIIDEGGINYFSMIVSTNACGM